MLTEPGSLCRAVLVASTNTSAPGARFTWTAPLTPLISTACPGGTTPFQLKSLGRANCAIAPRAMMNRTIGRIQRISFSFDESLSSLPKNLRSVSDSASSRIPALLSRLLLRKTNFHPSLWSEGPWSLVPQGHHRVHTCCSQCRNGTGRESDQYQEQRQNRVGS